MVDRVVEQFEVGVHPEPDVRPRVVLLRGLPQRDPQHLQRLLTFDRLDRDPLLREHLLEHLADEVLAITQTVVRVEAAARAASVASCGEFAAADVHMRAAAAVLVAQMAAGAEREHRSHAISHGNAASARSASVGS
jgi:hypothetical protein